MAKRIDGKAFALGLRERVGEAVSSLQRDHGLTPGLAVVLVGEDPASQVYVRNKGKQTAEAGMKSFEHKLPDTTSETKLLALVEQLNALAGHSVVLRGVPRHECLPHVVVRRVPMAVVGRIEVGEVERPQ